MAYDLDITSYNKELPSYLKSGHDPVPIPSELWVGTENKIKKVSTVR